MRCPHCIAGKTSITVVAANQESVVTITCITCHGSAEITEEHAARLKRLDAMWCRCGNPSDEASYHPDTPGSKHHWTCNDCGKVTQIG